MSMSNLTAAKAALYRAKANLLALPTVCDSQVRQCVRAEYLNARASYQHHRRMACEAQIARAVRS